MLKIAIISTDIAYLNILFSYFIFLSLLLSSLILSLIFYYLYFSSCLLFSILFSSFLFLFSPVLLSYFLFSSVLFFSLLFSSFLFFSLLFSSYFFVPFRSFSFSKRSKTFNDYPKQNLETLGLGNMILNSGVKPFWVNQKSSTTISQKIILKALFHLTSAEHYSGIDLDYLKEVPFCTTLLIFCTTLILFSM